ncbi:hypothetical protein E2C01_078434 [Portunus trituberculatus]|uniref:Uncharacterized protein n=1 Tax=Portunus trituberculatus TaxID=210409 RepID=A0A5B7ISR2_PORTR|nr:hypothetical protein [Portunus trituberculatus]
MKGENGLKGENILVILLEIRRRRAKDILLRLIMVLVVLLVAILRLPHRLYPPKELLRTRLWFLNTLE